MEYFDLTTPQKNIWNLQKYYGDTAIANQCGAIFYKEKRDSKLLKEALYQFIKSQTGMRLRFCEKDKAVQFLSNELEEIQELSFETLDEFNGFACNFAQKPMNLNNNAMYRFVVFQVEGRSGVLVVLSHLISDAWTFGIMANQVDVAYHYLEEGKDEVLLDADYTEYINAEKKYYLSDRYEKDKLFWESKYSVKPENSIIKLCSPAESIEAKRITKSLSTELEEMLKQYCKSNSVTPAVLFETALIVYLSHINYENKFITIGQLVLNRSNAKEKKIAGMFVSTMPLTVMVRRDMKVIELAKEISKEHMDIFRHQKYPYSDILKSLREKQNFSGNLYDVMISYQNAKTDTGAETKWYSNGASEVPFVVHIDNRDDNNSHTINVDYQTAVFKDKREVEYIVNRLEYILRQIVDGTEKKIEEISIISQSEYEKVVKEFNDTYVEYPREKCVHELFVEQVKKVPNKVALVFENEKFTYKKLDEMSNSLAHFLRNKGIKRNDIVPIISKRSWHVIVAMLGIIKAGAAFLAVDISHPVDRIKYIIDSVNAKILLRYRDNLSIENYISCDLEFFDYEYYNCKIDFINKADDLCYMVYTSGSTGEPKGLRISHYNAANFSNPNKFNINGRIVTDKLCRFLSVTNIIFDMFITEIFIPLTSGGIMMLANEKEAMSAKDLNAFCEKYEPNIIETTPTKLKMLLSDENFKYYSNFEIVILGGEALTDSFYHELSYITKGKIYNNYGPAETTVWSTISLVKNSDITIGSPIANTQIYILDKNNKLLPIGVAGELCIAGDGVGKGYLNRPDLTAEKFISNPFATEENHHGKILYRTGDLACWRWDGEIEYLGRIDTQVKIRGLRIELGEIESVMSGFEEIQLTAVTDKKDESGRQYLVGYYTSAGIIDEKALREHISAKLPRYMVPNYFMKLDTMPMTASGKLDRKNLPVPDFSIQVEEYVAAGTEQEKILCGILKEILCMDKVGVNYNFFEYGGDSLGAITYVAQAHAAGIEFDLQTVFDYPTVQKLCDFLKCGETKKVVYAPEEFDKYHDIFAQNVVDESYIPQKKPLGNVLLTGATGFLGAHVLNELMKEKTGKIYCLIRSGKTDDCRGRLYEILQYYFGDIFEADFNKRIIPIIGNIEKEGLADQMPTDVDTVIHTAASVKHYGSYSYFYKVNVEGTKHVVDYAKTVGAKLIHISTLSVSGNSMADDFSVYRSEEEKHFFESTFYMEQPLDNVYIRSKFEAEWCVYDAMLEGLDAKVIRVGNLTNRSSDYKFQPNYTSNAFLTRVKAILEFGLFPDYLMNLYAEFSPVDKTAEGVVKIAEYANKHSVFHLNSDRVIYFDRFLEVVHKLGISMKVVDAKTFNRDLQDTIQNSGTEYIFEAFQNDMDELGHLVYDSNIRLENDFTLWFLKKVGFEWNETDMEYISGYVDYFRKLGYLKV